MSNPVTGRYKYNGLLPHQDVMLIDFVRSNPILYDVTADCYRKRAQKPKVWKMISTEMQLPITDVKKRWKNIRDHYLKRRKLKRNETIRPGARVYMEKLQFLAQSRQEKLQNAAERNKGDETDASTEQSEDSQQSIDEDNGENHIAECTEKSRKCYSDSLIPAEVKQERSPTASCLTELDKSQIYKFFESMADIVAQFPPRMAAEMRLQVCQLVTEMELQVQNDQIDALADLT